MDLLNRGNPTGLAVWAIPTVRTLYSTKIFSDQFVWAETILLHVCVAVSAVLGEVPAAYNATVITTNPAADEVDAFSAVYLPAAS